MTGPGFRQRFQWSWDHLPHCQEIARDHVLRVRTATFHEDTRQATDLVVFTTVDLTHEQKFACRVRKAWALDKYPEDVTVRFRGRDGSPLEWFKIREGFGDWFIYGFADPAHYGRLGQWVVINLGLFREQMDTIPCQVQHNPPEQGGESFKVIRLRQLEIVPGLLPVRHGFPEPPQLSLFVS